MTNVLNVFPRLDSVRPSLILLNSATPDLRNRKRGHQCLRKVRKLTVNRRRDADPVQPITIAVWTIAICVIAVLLKARVLDVISGTFHRGLTLSEVGQM